MLKRVFGRVSVRETNIGIPDLVVAIYDLDPAVAPPPPVVVGVQAQAAKTEGAAAAAVAPGIRFEALKTRIGSVLTDPGGRFELPLDADTAAHYGADRVPDLVIVVFAPEDCDVNASTPLADAKRVLHLSYAPRYNAGPVEAFSIRLSEAQLAAFKIPLPAGDAPRGQSSPKDHVARFAGALQWQWDVKDELKTQLGKQLQARLTLVQKTRETGRKGFSTLMKATPTQRAFPYLVKPGDDVGAIHGKAIQAGLDRMASYGGGLTFAASGDVLSSLGLKQAADGAVSGEADPSAVQAAVWNRQAGQDLIRVRNLPDAMPPSPPPVVVQALREAPVEAEALATTADAGNPDGGAVPNVPAMTPEEAGDEIRSAVLAQLDDLLPAGPGINARPDIAALKADLAAFQPGGGPADATAYHDFNVLQVAFQDVWAQAFDENLRAQAIAAYQESTRLYAEAGLTAPDLGTIETIDDLNAFVTGVSSSLGVSPKASPSHAAGNCYGPSDAVKTAFPQAAEVWNTLSADQIMYIEQAAQKWQDDTSDADKAQLQAAVNSQINYPTGPGGQLASLLQDLSKSMSEPYAFDVFAPDTYNFGVLLTYRQRWEPLAYQTGDLVSTIPLAPREIRKYTHKQVRKRSRAEKEDDKQAWSSSRQTSEVGRAEDEIMNRATTATNFQMTSKGSFNIGIGSLDASTAFGLNQEQQSASTKKDFHESTLKAAEDYRHEHSIQVESSQSEETEDTTSGEISNPNNEITVTYLFYELQRRYQISERIHRARPVILVAQDVPAPHEVNEAWLIANQWIIARVLLDESLRPALEYLSSGYAGDEVSLDVLKASWQAQQALVSQLEALVSDQTIMRDTLRETLVSTMLAEAQAKASEMPTAAKIFTFGLAPDPGSIAADRLQAEGDAAKTRLQYVEQSLADAQKKLTDASAAFHQATQDYSAAMQKSYSRTVAIDQLRVHVKDNILYYMQAKWSFEPKDEQFFRLYNKMVKWFEPAQACTWTPLPPPKTAWQLGKTKGQLLNGKLGLTSALATLISGALTCAPTISATERQLVEVADLDSPLGYKGNYIIFPLTEPNYLTTFMMQQFVDDYFGVRDPDEYGNFTLDELTDYVGAVLADPNTPQDQKDALEAYYIDQLSVARPTVDEIVVPTGQLFIEALPGAHPLLEDYMLWHRELDVFNARAGVRHAELENLRLASRLIANELGDPDVERKIVVEGASAVTVDANG